MTNFDILWISKNEENWLSELTYNGDHGVMNQFFLYYF